MGKLLTMLLLVAVGGCFEGDGVTIPVDEADPSFAVPQLSRALARPSTWVDGELFNGVVTPATFDPASTPFDELYAGVPGGFKDGVPLISESKPGDQDYNGGRWHLNVLKAGVVTDYSNATSVADLDLNDFEDGETYFECPLLPARSNG